MCHLNKPLALSSNASYSLSWYSLNETPGDLAMEHFSIERDRETLLPFIRAALRHDPRLTLFASPWSPPTWMKHPCAYNYGSLRGEPEVHRAYALYFHRFVEAMRAEGIPVEAVHVQNEPDSDQKFPSCRWSGEKLRNFIRDHLGPLFADTPPGGRPCDVWLGTIERGCYRSWIAPALNDPEARKHIAGVGFQWAGSGAIQRTHLAWPDLPLAQTENECGDGENTWKHAEHVFNLFQHYLHNGASAYCYWNLALPHPKGLSTWGWPQNCMITVDPAQQTYALNPEFHLMRLLGHCARPGADIVPLSGHFAAHAVAFRDADTLRVALHNPFPHAQSVTLTHDARSWNLHLPPREIHVYSFPRP